MALDQFNTLYCKSKERRGSREIDHDKIYVVFLHRVKAPDDWVVDFAYGRRGKSLQHKTKTPKPVPFTEAARLYRALYEEKTDRARGANQYQVGLPFCSEEQLRAAFARVRPISVQPGSEPFLVEERATERGLDGKWERDAEFYVRRLNTGESGQWRTYEVERQSRALADLPIELQFDRRRPLGVDL